MCPVQNCLNIHSDTILPSNPRSSEWFFPSGFPIKILHASHLSHACCMCRLSHPPLFDDDNVNIRLVKFKQKLINVTTLEVSTQAPSYFKCRGRIKVHSHPQAIMNTHGSKNCESNALQIETRLVTEVHITFHFP
jgi:hypothetical protein